MLLSSLEGSGPYKVLLFLTLPTYSRPKVYRIIFWDTLIYLHTKKSFFVGSCTVTVTAQSLELLSTRLVIFIQSKWSTNQKSQIFKEQATYFLLRRNLRGYWNCALWVHFIALVQLVQLVLFKIVFTHKLTLKFSGV